MCWTSYATIPQCYRRMGGNCGWTRKAANLYGFDLCIELVRRLRADHPRLGLVICLPQIHLTDYYAELRRRIAEYGLEDHVLFITEPLEEAYPLWQASDVYLRATTTDGDALPIREALSLGVPVVASDASPRPPGTVLFPSRDLAARRPRWPNAGRSTTILGRMPSIGKMRFFCDLMEVYRTVLESVKRQSGWRCSGRREEDTAQ